jgi:crotonobetainyl-CoA:carnitine CoA-transferase CaiB-like acyl-CoA transferase
MSGLLSLLTEMNNPKPMGVSFADHLAGISAAMGILAALNHRTLSGQGQRVSTSLLESTLSFIGENAAHYFEQNEVPSRETRTHIAQVFTFLASDNNPFVIHLSSPAKFWQGLCAVIERPEFRTDPRFANRKARISNYDLLEAELAKIFHTRDRNYWLSHLQQADVPCGPLYDLKGAFADPQVRALGMVVDVPHSQLGSIKLVRSGINLSETPTAIRCAAPQLGEHNAEVLASIWKEP